MTTKKSAEKASAEPRGVTQYAAGYPIAACRCMSLPKPSSVFTDGVPDTCAAEIQ